MALLYMMFELGEALHDGISLIIKKSPPSDVSAEEIFKPN